MPNLKMAVPFASEFHIWLVLMRWGWGLGSGRISVVANMLAWQPGSCMLVYWKPLNGCRDYLTLSVQIVFDSVWIKTIRPCQFKKSLTWLQLHLPCNVKYIVLDEWVRRGQQMKEMIWTLTQMKDLILGIHQNQGVDTGHPPKWRSWYWVSTRIKELAILGHAHKCRSWYWASTQITELILGSHPNQGFDSRHPFKWRTLYWASTLMRELTPSSAISARHWPAPSFVISFELDGWLVQAGKTFRISLDCPGFQFVRALR